MRLNFPLILSALIIVSACSQSHREENPPPESRIKAPPEFTIDYHKFALDNGLEVIFHQDKSDPVVSVVLTSHVGSAREVSGRTGFAHLFEHLLFLESENLGPGGLDALSARVGGSGANGSTSRDLTNYYQTVPKDALEKMLWAEADKLGFFINTVTESVLAKEKQVVKNEKRQRVDNRPYGHTWYVIDKNLYPENHPYHWQTIGSLEDLQNATLADVKAFYRRWYTPNNVTLVVSGDFDPEQARVWVKKYFDEIPKGESIPALPKSPVKLIGSKNRYHEDNFARTPELTLTWPSAPSYSEDSYALDLLARLLADGKDAPLNAVLIDQQALTDRVTAQQYDAELAGQFMLQVRAYEGIDLDRVQDALWQGLTAFEQAPISDTQLIRIKAGIETDFYRRMSSVQGKGYYLARYNALTGEPGMINQDLSNYLTVSAEDIRSVYRRYIKDKPLVATSFVPKGQLELAVTGATAAKVSEEKITLDANETVAVVRGTYPSTPSRIDRSVEPSYGEPAVLPQPTIWQQLTHTGLGLYGIENREVPLVQFTLTIDGGALTDPAATPGLTNLMSKMINKGTATRTVAEFEQALEALGAKLSVSTGKTAIYLQGSTLARNYEATLALLTELITQPRWDAGEFNLAKKSVLSRINQQQANPRTLAGTYFYRTLYGPEHPYGRPVIGERRALESLSLDEVKGHFSRFIRPQLARFYVAGAVTKARTLEALTPLLSQWQANQTVIAPPPAPAAPTAQQKLFFYDVPGAKQSVLQFGYPSIDARHPDFFAAQVMNYRLGGGSFASILTQQLREAKGYTYGIGSRFIGNAHYGTFNIFSNVRTNVTTDATALIHGILSDYAANLDDADLATTKSYFSKSASRQFETLGDKLGMLDKIGGLGYPTDYARKRQAWVEQLDLATLKRLAREYIVMDDLRFVIVGDAATQLSRLETLGLGKPILLNPTSTQ